MKIFINPGHGGADCGACGNDLNERDVVLLIGQRVENYLRAVGYGVKLLQFDGLQAICDDANNFDADIFISIHCNAFDGNAHGTETFWSGFSEQSRRLADKIHNRLVSSLPLTNRGVKSQPNFFVLRNTKMPAVLVETAFIDNPADAKLLREREDDFAKAIARGVADFFANTNPLPDVIDSPSQKKNSFSEHFDACEFVCHCCGRGAEKIDTRLIELLEELRSKVQAPIHINCGYRCPKHNAEVGGVPNSQHVEGTAADIFIPSISFDRAAQLVKSLPFDGIGFYPPLSKGGLWFIHLDTRNGGHGSHIEWWE